MKKRGAKKSSKKVVLTKMSYPPINSLQNISLVKGHTVPTKLSGRTGKQFLLSPELTTVWPNSPSPAPKLHAARIASKTNLLETRGESLLAVAKTGLFPFDVGFSGAVQTHRYSGEAVLGAILRISLATAFFVTLYALLKVISLSWGILPRLNFDLLAWLAKEPKLMGKIINDEDLYCDFASLKYGRKITKADKIERQFGKGAILGLGYNMGAKKFKATD